MNKFKIPIILMGVLIFGESAGLLYFSGKSRDLSKKLTSIQPGYQKLTQEEAGLKNKNAEFSKENEVMKSDRENLLSQIKILVGERNKAVDLSASFERANNNLVLAQKEKKELQDYNLSLKEENKKFQESQGALIEERDKLKASYERARRNTEVKELNNTIHDLKKEKARAENSLKRKEGDFDKLALQKAKLESMREQLTAQVKEQKKTIAEGIRKNIGLAAEIKNIPSKFSEIARQNKKLIRQTSEMHYNLGVFYTKNKEYERAVAEFEKVVEITPDDSYAHFNLGYIYAEYLVNRSKAIEHFRHFLRLAEGNDKDVDWVKKYLLTWETYEGRKPMQ